MRLLRQISLDGSNILRPSPFSAFRASFDLTGANFSRRLSDAVNLAVVLLCDLTSGDTDKARTQTKEKKGKNKDAPVHILKVLEELNSLLVHLIRLSANHETMQQNSTAQHKPKSKLRRQYSVFEGAQFFRMKRSFSRQESDSSINNNNNDSRESSRANSMSPTGSPSPSTPPPKERSASAAPMLEYSPPGVVEEAVHKLVNSQVLSLLLAALPKIGFEEKKLVRIILTNSMILEVNKCHLVVDYLCEPSTNILQSLVDSYELGQSDVTLNCGCILRFASQYKPIVSTLLESDFFYSFFEYMKRSPADYPFDVAMDAFYTFKTILMRHKATTMAVLEPNPVPFFDAFVQLLRHADETENYVTKRQTLEIFANIFAGDECRSFCAKFIAHDQYICPVTAYLWNRNLQIRLRCLALLNQLFRLSHSGDGDSAQAGSDNSDFMESESENFAASVCEPQLNQHSEANLSRSNSSEDEPARQNEWALALLIDKMKIAISQCDRAHKRPVSEVEIHREIRDTFDRLKSDCSSSGIKQFTTQIAFVDRVLDSLQGS